MRFLYYFYIIFKFHSVPISTNYVVCLCGRWRHFKFHSVPISTLFLRQSLQSAHAFKFHSVPISTRRGPVCLWTRLSFKFHSVPISTLKKGGRDALPETLNSTLFLYQPRPPYSPINPLFFPLVCLPPLTQSFSIRKYTIIIPPTPIKSNPLLPLSTPCSFHTIIGWQ